MSSSMVARESANNDMMWLLICWLVGFPSIIFHGFLLIAISIIAICYKVFGSSESNLKIRQQMSATQSHIRDRIKSIVMMQANGRLTGRSETNPLPATGRIPATQSRPSSVARRLAALAVLLTSIVAILLLQINVANCLEQDAQFMQPVADLAKGAIKTATLGVPLEFHINPAGFVKNFAYFTWRTGFPVTMPRGFVTKVQDFYNRIRSRVDRADVKDIERKTLAQLRVDLDDIVDAIVEQVRSSPDGLYTDYLQTKVHGIPIEDACTTVGVQLKAYGVDLTNYRNIAGAVLGIPVMPTVASTLVSVGKLAPTTFERLTNFTSSSLPLTHETLFNNVPGALNAVSGSTLNSIDNIRNQVPVSNVVSPFSTLFSQTLGGLSTAANRLGGLAGDQARANMIQQQQPMAIASQP